MNLGEKAARRFTELDEQIRSIPSHNSDGSVSYAPAGWRQWATSAENLILGVFGEHSPHIDKFRHAYNDCRGWDYEVEAVIGIFKAAKADFEGGYLFDVDAQISGEIFGDFVALAKTALHDGSKDVAAVLACAALEDALKRYARSQELDVDDKVMQSVVAALKAKGLVAGAQKSLLDTMPRIRDYAMHANWEKLTAQDVGSVIGFVEQFLLGKFS
jgi:hypothetical protein